MKTWTMTNLHRAMLDNTGARLTAGHKFSAVTEENMGLAAWYAVDHMMAEEIMGMSPTDWFATRTFANLCALFPHVPADYFKGTVMMYRAGVENESELDALNEGYRFRSRVEGALYRAKVAQYAAMAKAA